MKHHPFSVPPTSEAKEQQAFTVTEVVTRWDQVLRDLGTAQVMGELSEYSVARSGHAYFVVSDGTSAMRGMLWKERVRGLAWSPQVGEQVLINGRAQVYKKNGSASFEAFAMFPAGEGLQAMALKALEARLEKQGLFDPAQKKSLPFLPRRVGVVSSSKADGLRDFLRSRSLRAQGIPVLFAEAAVQGATAAEACAAALRRLDESGLCDVIALVRGGGSSADLLPFSEEVLVRAVATCNTPVIVGIGHEPDHPICERAADRVAHTPTHAAELVFPEIDVLLTSLRQTQARMNRPVRQRIQTADQALSLYDHRLRGAINNRLSDARRSLSQRADKLSDGHPSRRLARRQSELSSIASRLGQMSPDTGLASARGQWDLLARRLEGATTTRLLQAGQQLSSLSQRLDAASPKAVLERGYTLVVDEQGEPLTSAKQASPGQGVKLRFWDGEHRARIEGDRHD